MLKSKLPSLLLSSTPEDEGVLSEATQTPEQDPFSQAATEIEDPKYPVLKPDRIIDMECRKAKVENSKGDSGRQNLVIQLRTVNPEPTTEGTTQPPGLVGTIYMGITPHEGYVNEGGKDVKPHTIKEIKEEMALLARAFFGASATNSARSIWDDPDQLTGLIAKIRIGIKKADGNFPEGNTFKFVSLKKA